MLLISSLMDQRSRQLHAGSPSSQIQEIVRVLDVTMCDFVIYAY